MAPSPLPATRMVDHFTKADPDYGRRVAVGLGLVESEASRAPAGATA